MKQTSKKLLSLVLCLIMIASSGMVITAQAVGTVKTLTVVAVSEDSVSLAWTAVSDADGYRVFRFSAKENRWQAIKTTSALSCVDSTVKPSETYYYTVRAYSNDGSGAVFGEASNSVRVLVPPEQVTGVRAVSCTETSINLTWDSQNGATGYLVYVYNPSARKFKKKADVTTNSCNLTGLNKGTTYSIAVKAYTKDKTYAYGTFSSILVTSTKGAQVPKNLQGTPSNSKGEIRLTWTGAVSNSGYTVYSYDATNGTWTAIASTKATSYTVTGLTETSTYAYAVAAYVTENGKNVYSSKSDSVSVYYQSDSKPTNIYSQQLAEKGIFGYLYDPYEKCFYTSADPWQRTVGYNSLFDTFSSIAFIDFDTVRLRFEYGGKDWMIQLWKGQYGLIFYGAEVGVYTKPKDRKLALYNCATDDEMLLMEMTFIQKRTTLTGSEWVEKFSRPYGAYWWCTGFIPGNIMGNYQDLKLDMRITMKDYNMLSGVTAALRENNIEYTVVGLDVYFVYE